MLDPGDQNALKIIHRQQAYLPVDNDSNGIFRVAEVEWDVGSENRRHDNEFTVIRVLSKGCLNVESSPGVTARAGELLVHPQNTGYHLQVVGDESCRLFMISVAGERFAKRWRRRFGHGMWHGSPANHHEMHHLSAALLARAEEGGELAVAACAHLLDLIVENSARSPAVTSIPSNVHPALMALADDLRQTYSVADIASDFGIDRTTLHRWCLQHFGCSPQRYRQRCRLRFAAQLLAETELSVHAIAERVGFSCPFAFSKAFKRHFGLPPSQCR